MSLIVGNCVIFIFSKMNGSRLFLLGVFLFRWMKTFLLLKLEKKFKLHDAKFFDAKKYDGK